MSGTAHGNRLIDPSSDPGPRPLRWRWASRLYPHSVRGFLLLLLLLILIPVLLVQAGLYYKRFQARQDQELQANLEMARLVASTFDATVRDILRQEHSIGIAVTSPDPPAAQQMQRLLLESARDHPFVRSYSWVGPTGEILSSSGTTGMDLGGQPFFQQIASGKEWVVSDLLEGRASQSGKFMIARGVRDDSGALLGVVVARVDPANLDQVLKVDRARGGSISIVDRQGRIVYSYPEMPVSSERRNWLAIDPSYARVLGGEEHTGIVQEADGRGWMAARVPILSIGWAASASALVDETMAPLRADLLRDGGVFALVASLAFLLAIAFGRRMTEPVMRLRESALAMGRGETFGSVEFAGPLELVELGRAFNRMAGDMRSREVQRDQLLERIKEQRGLFQAVVDNAPAGIAILDGRDLHFRFANGAFLGFLDDPYRRGGIVGLHLQSIMPRAEECGLADLFRKVVTTGQPHHDAEYEHHGFERGVVYWRWSLVPLATEEPGVPDLMMLATDITGQVKARKKVEELAERVQASNIQLEAERARLKAIIDSAPEGVVVADGECRILLTNPAANRLIGRPIPFCQEIDGNTIVHIFHPDGSPYSYSELPIARSALYGETHVNVEMSVLWPNGQCRDLLVNSAPIRDLSGGLSGAVAVFQDTTERKRSEQAQKLLAEASELLASSLEYEPALRDLARLLVGGFADRCIIDLIDGETIRTVAVADSDPSEDERLRGLAKDFPSGRSESHPAIRVLRTGKAESHSQSLPVDPGSLAGEGAQVDCLGGPSLTGVMVVPIIARARTLGVITLGSRRASHSYDMADLWLAEDLARRCGLAVDNARLFQQSQRAIMVRDEFLSVASHELRTPMTSLRGFTQLTLRQLAKESAPDLEKIRVALQVIDQQSGRLAGLISQLLDVSRLDAGRLTLDRRAIDLVELLRRVTASAQAGTSQHTLSLDSPPSLTVLGDSLRLEQVISNLLDNAIKYSPNGGRIEVYLSQPESGYARLAVRDHGIGISSEHRRRIFDRFYQANTIGLFGGLGLGLYISHEIVSLHGGRIEVESPPDGGSCFIVVMPTGCGLISRGEQGSR